jgi:hypothetical protein
MSLPASTVRPWLAGYLDAAAARIDVRLVAVIHVE